MTERVQRMLTNDRAREAAGTARRWLAGAGAGRAADAIRTFLRRHDAARAHTTGPDGEHLEAR